MYRRYEPILMLWERTRMGKIFDLLPIGKENAIKARRLMALTGARNERELCSMVRAERNEGYLILSKKDNGGGYYRAANKAELKEWVETFSKEARATFYMMKAARKELSEDTDQESFL